MQSLVVGLGRAGAGLHLPVLAKARARDPQLFGGQDVVGCDPRRTPPQRPGLVATTSIRAAAGGLDPANTVVHVCTPPTERHAVITELAELGFRNMVVEKPLASDADDLARIIRVRRKHRLHIEVVEPWLTSTLTRKLIELTHSGPFGAPKSITIVQNKPRFRRSFAAPGHPTAFDVELPHGVALALRLAGAARVTHAAGADLEVDGQCCPRMGGADIGLRHNSGVRTEISSDLTSPVRERRVTIDFAGGSAVGHFAVSDDDDHSQLTLLANGRREHLVLRDDSLTEWMIQAYRRFRAGGEQTRGFNFAAEVVQLLSVAKNICAEPVVPAARTETGPVAVAHHAG
ncbi:Predicted dehydrogenase [Lentzea xinjiangensis]|uniref:Predicted dehydrogenase n=1 Tax=Lentzea xinjiangensis TaxID=402600 RepID=A0A1H9LR93_9PSEU|nr:Gfo/Idh/MocA family oxidoreductase [Lentzea xinjiangensis]SER13910.1 Predicted dehydrogenase [Lentzea xinjiangensis]